MEQSNSPFGAYEDRTSFDDIFICDETECEGNEAISSLSVISINSDDDLENRVIYSPCSHLENEEATACRESDGLERSGATAFFHEIIECFG